MDDVPGWVPPPVDTSKPNVARMYDVFLGGKDNFAADREAAERFLQVYPDVVAAARANRDFLVRSVQAMAEALAAGEAVHARSSAPVFLRTMPQVGELLDGLDVVDPGPEDVHRSEQGRVVGVRAVKPVSV